MSEQTPPETVDTSDQQPAPQGTPGEPEIDWQKRYEDLRPQFDRTTQQLSQAEQDAQQWRQFQADEEFRAQQLQQLGYAIAEDDDTQYTDPTEHLAQKVSELEARIAEQAQSAQQAAQLAQIETAVEQQLAAIPDIDEQDKDWLVSRAVALPPTQDGLPDIQAAYREMQLWEQGRQKKWAQTKRAPHVSAVGTPGTQAPDLDDPQQRQAWMTERWQAASNDQ